MKFVEYTIKSGKKTVAHGVCHKSRLEYAIQDEGVLSASMIDDATAEKLMASWGGLMVEPIAVEAVA